MTQQKNYLGTINKSISQNNYSMISETISFEEYIDRVFENPKIIRNAYQRMYDMICERGFTEVKKHRKVYRIPNFFRVGINGIKIEGIEKTIDDFTKVLKGAAGGYGPEKRIILLHGPVGSAKSTICRLLKKGLEEYSRSKSGEMYTYEWVNLPTGADGINIRSKELSALREDPIKLIPLEARKIVLAQINESYRESIKDPEEKKYVYTLDSQDDLNPRCKLFMNKLLELYQGSWETVIEKHIKVKRMFVSEQDRIGIGTFQPKDEKNQDSTELTGDINYAKLSHFGNDSDPRAFEYDGEFCIGNRGCVEFIEMLKLNKEFLYDLLGASQEKSIKPKKSSQISIDTVLIGHSNNPEYEKLKSDQTMEAFRDRTVKIDVPYLLEWSKEIKVLENDYNSTKVKQHIAPHTLEIAALVAILTRLEVDPKDGKINPVEKAKLYDGQTMNGWTEDSVKEMKEKYPNEGFFGMSVRFVQDKISNCLASNYDYVNFFMVLNEMKAGLDGNSLINKKEDIEKYSACIEYAIKELDNILKSEVQKALVGDENAIIRLCANYIDNLMAYINKTKIVNQVTKREQEPDERLMRSIEEKIDIPEAGADDFRRSIAGFIGNIAHQGKRFNWDSNPKLKQALEKKLFEDIKDHIKLSALSSNGASTVDPDMQAKIDAVKNRLIKQFGYNEQSASDVLNHVGAIFARGDVDEDE